jgi:mitogen-activated protein kinase kinase
MELEVLHKSHNPYIVEFYGAFFIESCVYYCMEYMDGCSLDLACWKGTPEKELSYITRSVISYSFAQANIILNSFIILDC